MVRRIHIVCMALALSSSFLFALDCHERLQELSWGLESEIQGTVISHIPRTTVTDLGDGKVSKIFNKDNFLKNNLDWDEFKKEIEKEIVRHMEVYEKTRLGPKVHRVVRNDDGELIGYVMDKVPGEHLDVLIDAGKLNEDEVNQVLDEVERQLGVLKQAGLRHGDIFHGGNILVDQTDGKLSVRLIDFTDDPRFGDDATQLKDFRRDLDAYFSQKNAIEKQKAYLEGLDERDKAFEETEKDQASQDEILRSFTRDDW